MNTENPMAEPHEDTEPPKESKSDTEGFLAEEVNPARWVEKKVLFDDQDYSVVSGKYEGHDGTLHDTLGERWNVSGGSANGFPTSYGHPAWHVVPDMLEIPILHGLLDDLARNPTNQRRESDIPPGTEAQVRRLRILSVLEDRLRG